MNDTLEKKIELKDKLILYLKQNKIKFIISVILIFISLMTFFTIDFYQKKKTALISERYIKAGIILSEGKNDNAKALYEDIILSKNKFYSLLALNIILEKNLVTEKNKIINYFNILEKNVADEQKDLLIFKKALYLLREKDNHSIQDYLDSLLQMQKNLQYFLDQ